MRAPTAVIAEDEPLLRAEIRDLLQDLWPELEICKEAADGLQATEALDRLAPDIMFLDIQMPGASGLTVAAHASGRAHVVFITAFDEYAVAAFEHEAVDYIVKPLSAARMQRTVERLRQRLQHAPADLTALAQMLRQASGEARTYIKWLTVPHGSELRVVATAEIFYLRADNKYTTLYTRGSSFLLDASLKEMRQKLDPEVFWQIHRGIVVNVSAIEAIHRSFRGALQVKLKDRSELLPVSEAHAHRFKQV